MANIVPNSFKSGLLKGTFNLWNIQAGARYDQRRVKTKELISGFDKRFSGVNYSVQNN